MRMGIQDPIERHKKRAWKWPFQREEKSLPPKYRPPANDGTLPEYPPNEYQPAEYQPMEFQTLDGIEPG